ncbi:MAG: dephospho-CoA kinase [Fimbriimonadaceae bacterium]|nr:dephospho-CoA kinase [Alphaproteobacteria bacterium]
MVIIGLTGSIGAGKSTTGAMFAAHGIPVYDADAAVHDLYRDQDAVAQIERRFPGVAVDGVIDREKLSAAVLHEPGELRDLERMVHPLVHRAELDFLAKSFAQGHRFVVLEVPLLLETGGAARCDLVVTTLVSEDTQRDRVLARAGMTHEKFAKIRDKQMPMTEKKSRAHFWVDTEYGLDCAKRQVADIVRAIQPLQGSRYKMRLRAGKAVEPTAEPAAKEV